MNGYAIAIDGVTYDNGKNSSIVTDLVEDFEGDFKIPTLSLNDITAHSAGFNGTTTFTIADEKELLILSYALNSGALYGTTGYAYGGNALSRYGDYSKVGGTATGIADGKYKDDTFAVALPAAYFGIEAQTSLASTELIISLTSTDYDMTGYGNGFRGMSGTYSTGFIYKIKSFGNDSQKATIAVNMNMPQYAYIVESSNSTSGDIYDKDSLTAYGLFGRSACAVTFNNLVLTGNICVTTINYDNEAKYYCKSPGYYVGGLLGQMSVKNNLSINDVSLNNFKLVSPGSAGGLVGYYYEGTLTVTNKEGSDLSQNVLIKGQKYVGGCVGYVDRGTVKVYNFEILNSTIEAVQRHKKPSTGSQTGVGGIAGALNQNNAAIVMENCTVTKTAVVLYTSYSATDDSISSGGLLGWANTSGSITATGCTVDGCVVFALGNFSEGKFPYEAFLGSDSTVDMLSDDIKNNLIYNGENQFSVKVLAYLLEQNSSTTKYSIGSAGGLIGSVKKKVSLDGCTVTAKSAPMVIASLNDSAGLVGELRANVALEVKNCTVSTQDHDMYIMGDYRAAGVMAYRSSGSSAISLTDCNVVGTQENPIRIVQFMHNNGEASGLLGNMNTINSLTVTNCRVSYCIIAGLKASAIQTTTQASTGTLKNIHVDNSVIYSRNSYAGGLFNEYTATYSLEGVYLADNYVIGYTGAGGLVGTATSGSLSGKYIIMDNNTVCKGNQATNYTFATSDLTDVAKAASALYNSASPDFTNVGVIAGNNAVTVQLYAVSCSLPDSITTQQKNFYTDTGSSSYVIYNAYGARATYSGFTTEYDTKTPQQTAIEARNYSAATGDGSASLYGDSVTAGTPSTIAGLSWWVGDNETVGDESVKDLSTFVVGVTNNSDLPLFCFSDKTNDTLTAYLNMLTGGFSTLIQADSSLVSITSYRYSVADDGTITKLDGENNGSVTYSYNNVNGAYEFKPGSYDNLEASSKTFTVLSVTFLDSSGQAVYTMDLAIYYQQAINIKTYVKPLEGEQFYLPLFTGDSETGDSSINSFSVNVSYGSSFTLYIEYNYNSVIEKVGDMDDIGDIVNFNKRIEMVNSAGKTDANAKIESGTVFILLDLNSATPSGYSFYTLTLTEDKQYIDFVDFKNGENGFVHVSLDDLTTISSSLCKDTAADGCIYTERYLLVVFPVQGSGKTYYNMKAIIDDEQRQSINNIAVRPLVEVYGQVTIWEQPTMANSATYVDGTAEGKSFSYQAGDAIEMTVESTITYPDGYVGTLQGQGGAVYETHILQILDSAGKEVELPQRTIVKVTDSDSNVIYNEQLSASSQVIFSLGDVLTTPVKSYTVEIDFSHVNYNDFYRAFTGTESTDYTVMDSMYLSTAEDVLGIGPTSAKLVFNVKKDSKVKLAVVPDKDSLSNLCINLHAKENDDETNSGIIDFSLNALFDSSGVASADISFAVSKKVYNATSGRYEYVALSEEEADIWTVYKDTTAITGDSLSVADNEASGNYRLVVNKESANLKLTNYCLTVTLTADDGTSANDYFVFLVCNIDVERNVLPG
ncbi:MAG: hypothetical protein ACI4VK_02355 [Candidatus Coproplasma sp.]